MLDLTEKTIILKNGRSLRCRDIDCLMEKASARICLELNRGTEYEQALNASKIAAQYLSELALKVTGQSFPEEINSFASMESRRAFFAALERYFHKHETSVHSFAEKLEKLAELPKYPNFNFSLLLPPLRKEWVELLGVYCPDLAPLWYMHTATAPKINAVVSENFENAFKKNLWVTSVKNKLARLEGEA